MLDMKRIRQDAEHVKSQLQTRGFDPAVIDQMVALDEKRRTTLVKVEEMKKERNDISGQIAEKKRNKEDAAGDIAAMQVLSKDIKQVDETVTEIDQAMKDLAYTVPNLPHSTVPVGADEEDNVEDHLFGTPRTFAFTPKPHWEIAENLDILDFERGAKVTGSRFVYYKGLGARLERALYNFMLDTHVYEHGYTEVIPPYMVNSTSMFGTGQFPKFKEDSFQVEETDYTLIPTAEVPLTNYYRDEIVPSEELPVYFTALSPSFRSEAGSAGRDTRGLIRLHQFNKVEMVKLSDPTTSYDELEKMVTNAETILQKLGLPYRVITLCTGDMGFSAAKTYDLEVWIPAQDMYREISSCSNCEDFQARRAMIRTRDTEGKLQFVHTLNGSGLAVGRTVAAILENYQNEDGSVTIPEVLVPYMGGLTTIR